MLPEALKELPANRAVVLDNQTCAYCGSELTGAQATKEHVIGRRFVPKGTLDGEWNLIVRACERCNSDKGLLENDISAITLFGRAWADHFRGDDSIIAREARRKAKARSDLTGRPVGESIQRIRGNAHLGSGLSLKFNLEAPPQVSDERLHTLAFMQMRALFYFLTYRQTERRGRYWRGKFIAVVEAREANWGNARLRAFADAVASWEPRFLGFTAKGYFGAVIRKHPFVDCWSWGLEWNNHYRLAGFFGDEKTGIAIAQSLPGPKIDLRGGDSHNGFAVSFDVPLVDEDDRLFEWNAMEVPSDEDTGAA
jgi:hypothetical protein